MGAADRSRSIRSKNVYVVQANYDSSGFVENSRIFIYAHGATNPHRTLYAPGIEALSMTVAPGRNRLHIAGQDFPNTSTFSIVKFPPGSQTEQILPADPRNPIFPTGISLDAAGNLFAGWLSGGNRCSVVDLHGCVTDLPAGQNAWQLRLAAPSAANDIAGGPIVTSNGSHILLTTGFNYTYLETVRSDRKLPSQVISLSVIPCCAGGNVLLLDAAGDRVWAMQTFLGSSSTVYGIDYPGGQVSASFAVSAPSSAAVPTVGHGRQPRLLSGDAGLSRGEFQSPE